MVETVLEFKEICKSFGNNEVIKNIDFSVNKDEIHGLVGRSGSGKTTLFRLLLNIYKPTSGSILFHGRKVNSSIKKRIGFASQEGSFYQSLTVEENLQYFGKMYNLSSSVITRRIDNLLSLMQLLDARKTKAKNLSGGMKRRLDLAVALIHNPEILILDEPTTGLDIILNESIWDLILKIQKNGTTIIVSSHNLTEISKHCEKISIISQGRIFPYDLKKFHKNNLEREFRRLTND